MGIDRIFLNCAGCHAGSVRTGPGGEPLIVAGMPSNTVDLSAFQGFLARAAVDERFSADRFLAEIDARGIELDLVNRLALQVRRHRHGARAAARHRRPLRRLRRTTSRPSAPAASTPSTRPRRCSTGTSTRSPKRERIGVVDFPSVFLQGPKEGMQLHWDGNNTKVSERNRSAAFGTGATPPILDRDSLKRMEDWLATAEPPALRRRLPRPVRRRPRGARARRSTPASAPPATARSGRDFTGEYVGKVTPIAEVGTDRGRLDNYTHDLAVNQNVLYAEFGPERFQTFRKTDGYANAPLDGLWLRAPYLHNGSVPTLAALLSPPDERPARVPARLRRLRPAGDGLRQRPGPHRPGGPAAPLLLRHPRRRRAALPGRGAADERHLRRRRLPRQRQRRPPLGHRRSPPDEKRALIEYLKTF